MSDELDLFLYVEQTTIDDSGYYYLNTWYYNTLIKKVYCKIREIDAQTRTETCFWTRELSDIETEKFLHNNSNNEVCEEKIKQIKRDIKISKFF